ncbi:MAG TPA: hypothetical protein VEK15_18220 [Vicinamibacteria bacterium]|nr:hypothetical protein [Vicinamibacteria bacterium]
MQHVLRFAVFGMLGAGSACENAPASQQTVEAVSESDVVARVGDREITLKDVDARAVQTNMQAFQQLYDARRQAVDDLVAEALIAEEAAARDLTEDELIAREVTANIRKVDEAEVEEFFNQNRNRLGGQSLEQVGPQIRQYLEARNETVARAIFIERLRSEMTVKVSLAPPRIPITVASGERMKGPADAKVTIVEYSDFQ